MLLIQYWLSAMASEDIEDVLNTLPMNGNDITSNPPTDTNNKSKSFKTEKKKKEKKTPAPQKERIVTLIADNEKTLTVDLGMTISNLESRMADAVNSVKDESTEMFYEANKIKEDHENNKELAKTNAFKNIIDLINKQNEVYNKIKMYENDESTLDFMHYYNNLYVLVNAFEAQLQKLLGVKTVSINIKKQINDQKKLCKDGDEILSNPVGEYFFKIGKRCYHAFYQYDKNNLKELKTEDFVDQVTKFKNLQKQINEGKKKPE